MFLWGRRYRLERDGKVKQEMGMKLEKDKKDSKSKKYMNIKLKRKIID